MGELSNYITLKSYSWQISDSSRVAELFSTNQNDSVILEDTLHEQPNGSNMPT